MVTISREKPRQKANGKKGRVSGDRRRFGVSIFRKDEIRVGHRDDPFGLALRTPFLGEIELKTLLKSKTKRWLI